MATAYKALTRPTLLCGVPIAPFIISVFCLIILGLIITKWMWLLILVLYFLMRNMTARDEHVFTLVWVGWKALGKKSKLISRHVVNRFFGARAISHTHYDNIDMREFLANMKLNQRQPIEEFIPYSTHIHPHICKTRRTDYVATWELSGEAFQCQTIDILEMLSQQFNKALVSFSGESVTFYAHTIREKHTDCFDSVSGNKVADKVMSLYYRKMKKIPFYRTRIFLRFATFLLRVKKKWSEKQKDCLFRKKHRMRRLSE